MGSFAEDPLYRQTITGPDGVLRTFKELSQTITELESGVAPVNALEQQREASKPIIALYTTFRGSATEEHKRSECGWICDGRPHYAASVCRICKGKAGPQNASAVFSVNRARNHIANGCRPLSSFQRSVLCRAFTIADAAFIAAEENSGTIVAPRRPAMLSMPTSAPIVTASSSNQAKGKKRAHRSETELDMEQDEILERQLAEEDRRQYRPSPVSSVDEEELLSRYRPAPTILATPPQSARPTVTDRGERLNQRSTRKDGYWDETPEASTSRRTLDSGVGSVEEQAAPVPPASKKRKLKDAAEQEASGDRADAHVEAQSAEPSAKPKKSSKSKEKHSDETRKLHAHSAPAESLPHTPSSEPPKAEVKRGDRTATLADFGQLLKAANLTDLDELKAGLDHKRVPRFVGYLAETFPGHISSHLARFNLIEAFERFLEDA